MGMVTVFWFIRSPVAPAVTPAPSAPTVYATGLLDGTTLKYPGMTILRQSSEFVIAESPDSLSTVTSYFSSKATAPSINCSNSKMDCMKWELSDSSGRKFEVMVHNDLAALISSPAHTQTTIDFTLKH
jgi:hypothetical protein